MNITKKSFKQILEMVLLSLIFTFILSGNSRAAEYNSMKKYNAEVVSVSGNSVQIKIQGGKGYFYFEPIKGMSLAPEEMIESHFENQPNMYEEEVSGNKFGVAATDKNRLLVTQDLGGGSSIITVPISMVKDEEIQFIFGFTDNFVEGDNNSTRWPSSVLYNKKTEDVISDEEIKKSHEENAKKLAEIQVKNGSLEGNDLDMGPTTGLIDDFSYVNSDGEQVVSKYKTTSEGKVVDREGKQVDTSTLTEKEKEILKVLDSMTIHSAESNSENVKENNNDNKNNEQKDAESQDEEEDNKGYINKSDEAPKNEDNLSLYIVLGIVSMITVSFIVHFAIKKNKPKF